jgi:DNA-binding GntR family transcriptional regulator
MPFLLASEYQLCRRFKTSRVTVRLALKELEYRGLIYRKHGAGTFAHGRLTRLHHAIAVLVPSRLMKENRLLAEIIRGVRTFAHALPAAVVVVSWSDIFVRLA